MQLLALLGQVLLSLLHNQTLTGIHLRNHRLPLQHTELLLAVLDGRLDLALITEVLVLSEAVSSSSNGVLSEIVACELVAVSQQVSVQVEGEGFVVGHGSE